MFYQRLLELAKSKKKSLKVIGKELSFSENLLYKYKNDKYQPKIDTLESLASYFDVSVDYLLGNTDKKNSTKLDEDLEKSLNTFKSFDGKPMNDEDREVIREMLKRRMKNRQA